MANTTKDAAHTPAPWGLYPGDREAVVSKPPAGPTVADCIKTHVPSAERAANARRIAAAVNAVEGIPTEALEDGVVSELLEAAEKVVAEIDTLMEALSEEEVQRLGPMVAVRRGELRAAIAKAKGGD